MTLKDKIAEVTQTHQRFYIQDPDTDHFVEYDVNALIALMMPDALSLIKAELEGSVKDIKGGITERDVQMNRGWRACNAEWKKVIEEL